MEAEAAELEHHDHPPPPPPLRPIVPPGYHFTPKPEELINSYLVPWIAGEPLAGREGIVCHGDVYDRDPAALTEALEDFAVDGQYWYFFCVRRRMGRRRRSIAIHGGGVWVIIGARRSSAAAGGWYERRFFRYVDAAQCITRWHMEEIASSLDSAVDAAGEKVICKVYLSPAGRGHMTPARGGTEEKLQVGAKRRRLAHEDATGGASAVAAAPPMVVCRRVTPESTSKPGGQEHGEPAGARPSSTPLTMVSANEEELRFAQTDGVEFSVDVAAMSDLLDRVLGLSIGDAGL